MHVQRYKKICVYRMLIPIVSKLQTRVILYWRQKLVNNKNTKISNKAYNFGEKLIIFRRDSLVVKDVNGGR